jgi:hypothetical protein
MQWILPLIQIGQSSGSQCFPDWLKLETQGRGWHLWLGGEMKINFTRTLNLYELKWQNYLLQNGCLAINIHFPEKTSSSHMWLKLHSLVSHFELINFSKYLFDFENHIFEFAKFSMCLWQKITQF